MDIKKYTELYQAHKENPVALSDPGFTLASDLATFGSDVAMAELEEKSEAVRLLNSPITLEEGKIKKMSSTEADTTAVVNTLNVYGRAKLDRDSGYKILDSINTRIMALMNERNNTK